MVTHGNASIPADGVERKRQVSRHCEEREHRSNPSLLLDLDCFAFGSQ